LPSPHSHLWKSSQSLSWASVTNLRVNSGCNERQRASW
jgi:hypothetical protein